MRIPHRPVASGKREISPTEGISERVIPGEMTRPRGALDLHARESEVSCRGKGRGTTLHRHKRTSESDKYVEGRRLENYKNKTEGGEAALSAHCDIMNRRSENGYRTDARTLVIKKEVPHWECCTQIARMRKTFSGTKKKEKKRHNPDLEGLVP